MDKSSNAPEGFRENLIRYGADFHPEFVERAQGCYVYDETGGKSSISPRARCAPRSATITRHRRRDREELRRGAASVQRACSPRASRSCAERMAALAAREPLPSSIFLNTGGESNEAALRLAKQFTGGFEVVGLDGSWHGTTARRQLDHLRQRPARLRARRCRAPSRSPSRTAIAARSGIAATAAT